jgi:predicted transcriptional regulator of viral defense system
MSSTEPYAELRGLGAPVVRTREAAALWGTDEGNARRRLQSLVRGGLATSLRPGLWGLDTDLDPFALAPYLTAPLPAYVSTFSALAAHAMIEQIPGRVSVVSLDRARRIKTTLADFEIHHLVPELFGGYVAWSRGGSVASPEKALFDLVYLRAAAGGRAFLPELSLPEGFERAALDSWVGRIGSSRLKTIVADRLSQLLAAVPTAL